MWDRRYNVPMFRRLFLVLVIATTASAQTTHKPLFPLPTAIEELKASSAVAADVRSAIEAELAKSSCKPSGAEKYEVAEIDLRHEGQATVVRVEEPCLCGASDNCPIFVVERSKVVLPDGSGFGFAMNLPAKGDSAELVIASHTSPNVTALQRYRWKGGRFKLRDCEAAVRKDDAKAKWNPEEMEIAGCDAIALK